MEMVYVVPVLVLVNVDCVGPLGMYACLKAGSESALAVSIRGSGWMGEDIVSGQCRGIKSLVTPLPCCPSRASSLSCIHVRRWLCQ